MDKDFPAQPSYEELQGRIRLLEKNQDELNQMFSMILDMICVADLQTTCFLKVNQAFTATLGYAEEELLGNPFFDFIHPEDIQQTRSVVERKLRSGDKVINFENRYRCKDGGYRWLSWMSHPNIEKGITYAIARDITQIKQTENSLRKSEERYKNLFNSINDGICLHEIIYRDNMPVDYRILDINPRYEELTGIKGSDAKGAFASQLYGTGMAPYLEIYADVAGTGKHVSFETYFPPMKKHFLISVFSPASHQFATVFQDITERKKAENAIKRKNEFLEGINHIFETVVTSAGDEEFGEACLEVAEKSTGSAISFIGEIGQDGMLHDIAISNPAWQACSMYDHQGHRKPPGNFHVHGLYGSVLNKGETLLVNDPASHPERIGLPPGHPPLTSFLGVPLKQQDRTIGMVAAGNREGGYGIQEKEALESIAPVICEALARRRAEKALKVSLAEKEILLKEIHHRVKNNMQVISSLVDLQANDVKDGAMRDIFKDVIYRVRSMALVHEKLYRSNDFARVEFADYARSHLSYLWRAQRPAVPGVKLELDLEPVLLRVNEAVPCGLVLNELFTNALKHAFVNRGSGTVTVSLRRDAPGRVSLSVQDNGVGLPPGMDTQGARSLGLRLVQMLAGQLHAAVKAESDQGTKFTMTFEAPGS